MGFNQQDAAEFCGVSKWFWASLEKLDYLHHYPENRIIAISCHSGIEIDLLMSEECRGQNFGKIISQEVEASSSQLRALANYQSHYCERALLLAPDEELAKKELASAIKKAVHTLPPRQQTILNMKYGLNGTKPMSSINIAKKMKRSVEAINVQERSALKNLQDSRRVNIIDPAM